ncbi:hypothetical protein [Flavobacterium sp.]|uniref:hypothetical protein n=1 Tax=Flavobacterium sp. TaxID=239 RepID=UPI002EDAF9EB
MGKKKEIARKEVDCIVKKYNIRIAGSYSIKNGLVDIDGDFYLTHSSLRKLPLRFGKVSGDFICSSNRLQTLSGAPFYVAGNFNCYGNQLKSLKYAPLEVGGDFSSHENELTSLLGSPKCLNGSFNVFLNQLENLNGGPEKVAGSYYAFKNRLTTLSGAPSYIGRSFHISGNKLKNLIGCPEYIGDILSFDDGIGSLFMGSQNCEVNKIVIETQEKKHNSNRIVSAILKSNLPALPILFKYMNYTDIFSPDGTFNRQNFEDMIFEIDNGLR